MGKVTFQARRVSQLRVGDTLTGSGVEVLVAPTVGAKTPSGKVDLKVMWPSGDERWHTWGRNTIVGVIVR